MTTPAPPSNEGDVIDRPLGELIGDKVLSYALSTIMSRSLPDVRDGLKPVHRRLLYAMLEAGLRPGSSPRKCAAVVGAVLGQYHPHGDIAVYEALVRLAQDFVMRTPLVDGQGNFGNIDGDAAAAQRYTEARLTEAGAALLAGIAEDAVEFRETYDGHGREPVVLPAAFPNLLANGAAGIAVGMATSIPPHNLGELCGALLLLLETPNAPLADIMAHVGGPDFPTGGVLVEAPDAIAEAYRTGRGAFRLRARHAVERLPGGQWQSVVNEIPYGVPKSKLVERIAELLLDKKLPLLDDVRDESDSAVRLVLVPKSRGIDHEHLMASLFRDTDLEVRVPLNMNVLDRGILPRVMSLAEVLTAFLDHRRDVLLRRTRHRLAEIDRRLEVLAGYLVVFLDLDRVIRIIREEDEPKPALIAAFGLTDVQAEAILNMRLRALRRLEEMEIRREHTALSEERGTLAALLEEPRKQRAALKREIQEIDKRFGQATKAGARRTQLAGPPAAIEVPPDAHIEREPLTVLCSQKGWVRAVRGHQLDLAEVKYKEGDAEGLVRLAQSTDRLLAFGSDGRIFTLGADRLPRGRGFGEPLRLLVDLGQEAELVALETVTPTLRVLLVASDGRGFVAPAEALLAEKRGGRQVMVLDPGDRLAFALPVPDGADHVAVLTKGRMAGDGTRLLVFPLAEVAEMARGRGVAIGRKGAALLDVAALRLADGLVWGPKEKRLKELEPWLGKRAGAGRALPRGYERAGRLVTVR